MLISNIGWRVRVLYYCLFGGWVVKDQLYYTLRKRLCSANSVCQLAVREALLASCHPCKCALSTVHCTCDSAQFTVYTVQCTVYTVNCMMWTLHCKLYTVHCILYSLHVTHIKFILSTSLYTVYLKYNITNVNTVQSLLYTETTLHRTTHIPAVDHVHYILYNVYFTLFTTHCTLYTMTNTLYNTQWSCAAM